MLLFAVVLLCATSVAAPGAKAGVPDKHWTHRGGPYHWFTLRPFESRFRRGALSSRYHRTRAPDGEPVSLLMQCKAPEAREPARPLTVLMVIRPPPGDWKASPLLDSSLWFPGLFRSDFDESGELRLVRASNASERIPIRVTRQRVTYSTNSHYRVHLPPRVVARAFADPGTVTARLDTETVSLEAVYVTTERTGGFLEACEMDDTTWKETRWRYWYEHRPPEYDE